MYIHDVLIIINRCIPKMYGMYSKKVINNARCGNKRTGIVQTRNIDLYREIT